MAANPQAVIATPNASGWRLKAALPLRLLATLLLLGGVVALLGWCVAKLNDPATLPISKIRVQGSFVHLNEAMLQRTVAGTKNQGFFSVDIAAVKQQVEQLPWVKQAAVRRIWPDTLGIEVVEQKAVARWAAGGLVNRAGENFRPAETQAFSHLPLFVGPQNMLAAMREQYRQSNALLITVGLRIAELAMNSRRALTLQLTLPSKARIELVLGREETAARLQRFIRVYKKLLMARSADIARVDLRYSNGLSVQWKTGSKQNIHQAGE